MNINNVPSRYRYFSHVQIIIIPLSPLKYSIVELGIQREKQMIGISDLATPFLKIYMARFIE
ncbi:hypothetical protein L593_13665 [Salinarchaeum sp. Harcht-Bsk1]|nr:hypothetical protein L593_13665 [Salinarchaeum sp. Harcht-Bsk1]